MVPSIQSTNHFFDTNNLANSASGALIKAEDLFVQGKVSEAVEVLHKLT